MTDSKQNRARRRPSKQQKPYRDYPLSWHPSGQWCKRIKGTLYYFGSDAEKALERYLRERDWIVAGKTPPPIEVADADGLRLRRLLNEFLNAKRRAVDAGEMTERSLVDYKRTAKLLVQFFDANRLVADLRPRDFEDLKRWFVRRKLRVTTIVGEVTRVKAIFRYGHAAGLLPTPMIFGVEFKRPPQRLLRQQRNQRPKLFTAEEIRKILDYLADVEGLKADAAISRRNLRAMVLLGVNVAFGPSDAVQLEWRHVDLNQAIVDFPRPKTAIPRRAALWPETVAALELVRSFRPINTEHPNVFLSAKWKAPMGKGATASPVTREFTKTLKALGLHVEKRGFYTLRHVFRTVSDSSLDLAAIKQIMGHASDTNVSGLYLHGVDDDRLRRVAEHVRSWLFGGDGGTGRKPEPAPSTPRKPRLKVVG